MHPSLRSTLLFALFFCAQITFAAAAEPTLYAKAKQASVAVLCDGHLDGSGWFTDSEGWVVTASHVVARPDRRIEILSPAAGRLTAKLVAVDLGHDLALLKVDPREGGYPALKTAEKAPSPGEDVYVFGAPIFRTNVMLRGMVARDDTTFEYFTEKYIEVFHIAATVQGGTSGGPWLNASGEVVGLQSGVMSHDDIPVGIAHAAPAEAIRRLATTRRSAETPLLGAAFEEIWQQGSDTIERFPQKSEGLVVKIVRKDLPIDRAGIKVLDMITAVDGKNVARVDELLRIVRAKKPGETLRFSVASPDGAGTREAPVTLGKLEIAWP